MNHEVINSDNITALKNYPDNYFDSIVTDPPYGLGKEPDAVEVMTAWATTGYHEIKGTGFMGKEWDAFVPQPLFWKEVFRVLKPGGHCLAFYGTRTYDWGVMAMRFAGFEVRDCIQWLYGSGFPKSHNIGKAIDKLNGAKREILGYNNNARPNRDNTQYNTMKGKQTIGGEITSPATEEAKQWEGWGSALKPANEPIVLARKPLEKGLSIAENVLKWGTGGINIDGCRIGFTDDVNMAATQKTNNLSKVKFFDNYRNDLQIPIETYKSNGRFPANIILDEKAAEILDEQSGVLKSGKMTSNHNRTTDGSPNGIYGKFDVNHPLAETYGDLGGASRFFYVAKASKSERNRGLDEFEEKPLAFSNQAKAELKRGNTTFDGGDAKGHGNSIRQLKNFHPTVKPVKLMQYLVRLVTPPNGIVLDPFCGSGTTGVACKLEGFNFVGIEQDAEYCKIAEARIKGTILEAKQNELF